MFCSPFRKMFSLSGLHASGLNPVMCFFQNRKVVCKYYITFSFHHNRSRTVCYASDSIFLYLKRLPLLKQIHLLLSHPQLKQSKSMTASHGCRKMKSKSKPRMRLLLLIASSCDSRHKISRHLPDWRLFFLCVRLTISRTVNCPIWKVILIRITLFSEDRAASFPLVVQSSAFGISLRTDGPDHTKGSRIHLQTRLQLLSGNLFISSPILCYRGFAPFLSGQA